MAQGVRDKLEPEVAGGTLGTFAGVFTPSILTILGAILFLRMGYVIENSRLVSNSDHHIPLSSSTPLSTQRQLAPSGESSSH